ncbi:MAG TPA: response regulator [Phycisphaerales bacterium]|nr:response regulator [Phycisphaerales bacterium]
MSRQHVLLVDDEPHVTHVLSRKLQRAGLDVRIARDGEEAQRLAHELIPDIVVTDLQMPRVDGLGLALGLAASEQTCNVPILMLSGRGFLLDAELAQKTRIVRILEKPFSATEILACVREILESSTGTMTTGQAA